MLKRVSMFCLQH